MWFTLHLNAETNVEKPVYVHDNKIWLTQIANVFGITRKFDSVVIMNHLFMKEEFLRPYYFLHELGLEIIQSSEGKEIFKGEIFATFKEPLIEDWWEI